VNDSSCRSQAKSLNSEFESLILESLILESAISASRLH
jgi:hypothetical protein